LENARIGMICSTDCKTVDKDDFGLQLGFRLDKYGKFTIPGLLPLYWEVVEVEIFGIADQKQSIYGEHPLLLVIKLDDFTTFG
jgi:hypothetical protein